MSSLFPELDRPYALGWDGTKLKGTLEAPIAFDTETFAVDESGSKLDLRCGAPKMVLATVSDGLSHFVLHPGELAGWLLAHRDEHLVGHNFAFDFWVVERVLREGGEGEALKLWWDRGDRHLYHDTMLLDLLVMLAEGRGEDGSQKIENRNLGVLARQYAPKVKVNKEDPFRLRYHEVAAVPRARWEQDVDPGFFQYAIDDARATHEVWRKMLPRARALQAKYLPLKTQKCYAVYHDAPERFGVLTEQVQVLGSIALAAVTYNGMRFDAGRAREMEDKVRADVAKAVRWLRKRYPALFTFDKAGNLKVQPKSKMPSLSRNFLKGVLQQIANANGFKAPQSTGKEKGISVSVEEWADFEGSDPFLKKWMAVAGSSKILAFFDAMNRSPTDVIHPSYRVLVRTGRTSCSRPNIQQSPRDAAFRRIFVPAPGKLLATIDYSSIELRTLATIARLKLGHSKMAEVLRWEGGRDDPYAYSASMILGVPFEDFVKLKKDPDPAKRDYFAEKRKASKPLVLGIPGGLAPDKLAKTAKSTYGVEVSVEEADKYRNKIINEVFPELNEQNGWLASFSTQDLAKNTGVPHSRLEEMLKARFHNPAMFMLLMGRVASGVTESKKGKKYAASVVDRLWEFLNDVADEATLLPEDLVEKIRQRKPGFALASHLFGGVALTLTGRPRKGVGYTQLKNGPFQGLAADGAKLALWRLAREGFKVRAFVHDEVVVEVDEATAAQDLERIDRIMVEEMGRVLTPPGADQPVVPVKCEGTCAPEWSKP